MVFERVCARARAELSCHADAVRAANDCPPRPMPPGRDGSRPSESLVADERVRRRLDYQRCYEKGRRGFGTHLTLFFVENGLAFPRFGITASRKVGGAVVRSRLKRLFREIYRRWPQRTDLPSMDFVVHVKPSAAQAAFKELRDDLIQQLERAARKQTRRAR